MVGKVALEELPEGFSEGAEEDDRLWQDPKARLAAAPVRAVCKNCLRFTAELSSEVLVFYTLVPAWSSRYGEFPTADLHPGL